MVGDIVGAPGRKAFAETVKRFRSSGQADVVVANAENAAGGKGVTAAVVAELLEAGADVLTLGDHTWDQKEAMETLEREPRLIRPANFPPGCPGRGVSTFERRGVTVNVINLVGRVFMSAVDCPFRTADRILAEEVRRPGLILVDIHAEATSEKIVIGRYLDGRVTAVVGTHTHVQTSDDGLLPNGTAYMTDLGMTGPREAAIGRDLESVTAMFLTAMPARFRLGKGDAIVEGAIIDVDDRDGRAASITRVRERPATWTPSTS